MGSPFCRCGALRHALRKSISASRLRPEAEASLPERISDATSLALLSPGLACRLSLPSPEPALGSTGFISQLPATAATNAVLAEAAPMLRAAGAGDAAYGPSPPRKLIMPTAPAATPATRASATIQPVREFLTMAATLIAPRPCTGGTVRTGADRPLLRRVPAARALLLAQAQHAPLHLARGGHGQGVDELDLLRVLVRRELAPDVRLQLLHEFGVERALATGADGALFQHVGREHDVRLHQRAALGVRLGHDRGVDHRGVLDQAILDLAGPDAVARRLEHVVGASLVPEIAVDVARSEVAGAAPVAGELAL